MTIPYTIIEIYTSEEPSYKSKPAWQCVVDMVAGLNIAARTIVTKGFAGCNESGEISAPYIEVLLYNLPVKIEIALPSSERDLLLTKLDEIIKDGIVFQREQQMIFHKTHARLLPRHIKVKDVMTQNPIVVQVETPLRDAIKSMLDGGFNGLPVINSQHHPVGMITQGDLITRAGFPLRLGLLNELASENIDDLLNTIVHKTINDIMSTPVKTVLENMYLTEAIHFMLKHNLKRVPVINPEGRLTGMLARLDVFRYVTHSTAGPQTWEKHQIQPEHLNYVKDIMERTTQSVSPETPIEEIIQMIFQNENHRIAVTDVNHKLIGIISSRDLFARFAEKQMGLWPQILSKIPLVKSSPFIEEIIKATEAKTAADVMHTNLLTVSEDTPIQTAISIMTQKQLKRLPVVDSEGGFKGMISRDAVLRAGMKEN